MIICHSGFSINNFQLWTRLQINSWLVITPRYFKQITNNKQIQNIITHCALFQKNKATLTRIRTVGGISGEVNTQFPILRI